ncbi:MAG: aminoacyl-tRNA hydrolase [Candidatus Mcinerneyibacterium aminivorans]|uniref:Peptidyl-tRNA hydrolase n=1 Tax=Candidatus Mcinerneyibacterium aminivorans TaxID=2703815 RepID=A0A5D0MII1_9BACT|nr:MAG: aminoacyl-tRNA hydrolase [Candidatus Mcinerneyibacterium aminivorans]
MYYIIGLGNPGIKYINTRHNAGFLFLDYLNDKYLNQKEKDRSSYRVIEGKLFHKNVRLIKPQTFMNLSGKILYELQNDYNDFENFIVVYDDVDLPLGTLRIRDSGSSGGHNGIKSIINVYESQKFPRIRIGIKNPDNLSADLSEYVLDVFEDKELETLIEVFEHAERGLKHVLNDRLQKAMSVCNGIQINLDSNTK